MRILSIGLMAVLVATCGGGATASPSVASLPGAASTAGPATASAASTASPSPSVWDDAHRLRACWAYSAMGEVAQLATNVETALAADDLDGAYMSATLLQSRSEGLTAELDRTSLGPAAESAGRELWAASYNLGRYATLVIEGIAEGNERRLSAARSVMQRGMTQVVLAADFRVGLETGYGFSCLGSGRPRVDLPEPPVLLQRGDTGMVYTDNLRLRSNAWIGDDSVKHVPTLDAGTLFTVLDGPVYGSGYWWYLVELTTVRLEDGINVGWLPSASRDGCEWIEVEGATDPGCPDGVM